MQIERNRSIKNPNWHEATSNGCIYKRWQGFEFGITTQIIRNK